MTHTTSYLDVFQCVNSKTTHSVGKIKYLIENDDLSASDELYRFLNEIEDIFRRNQLSEFTAIATYRIELLASRWALDQRIPQKRFQLDKASALIPNITKTVSNALKPIENKINTARKIIQELVCMAYDSNMIHYQEKINFADFSNGLWTLFLTHDSFKEKATLVSKSLSKNDIIILISEEIHQKEKISPSEKSLF
ncbi:hypothetical protein [Galbibacter orientalis]|uniref:hypothetical protein n=1 Tax=Galbibacter orientalis TaxID=453852 RepID=UPI003080296F